MDAKANGIGTRSGRGPLGGSTGSAGRIVLTYAVVASAWILFSDSLARALSPDPDQLTMISGVKGVLFVLVTSALLFIQIRGDLGRLQETGDRLRESEERFRCVVELSPIPMTLRDADGTVTLVNAAFVKLMGYTQDDIPTLAQWWPAAYPDPEYRAYVIAMWEREVKRSLDAGGAFVPFEARIHSKDGTERIMLVSAASLGAASSEQVVVYWDITERERAEAEVLRSNERLEQVLRSVIALIGKIVEARDPYTQGHEEGVARIARLIAAEMGLPAADVDGIEVAALVHDVGKVGVPAEILTKPGVLTDAERALIKGHAYRGYEILKDVDFDWPVAATVLHHHERMDGTGYPDGLAGDQIPISSRILTAADVIDAMVAHRPYRAALGLDAAMAEITQNPEKYDPQVASACMRLHEGGRLGP